jgi:hypothetical protein
VLVGPGVIGVGPRMIFVGWSRFCWCWFRSDWVGPCVIGLIGSGSIVVGPDLMCVGPGLIYVGPDLICVGPGASWSRCGCCWLAQV